MSDSYIIINAGPEVSCAHPFILEVMVRKLVTKRIVRLHNHEVYVFGQVNRTNMN